MCICGEMSHFICTVITIQLFLQLNFTGEITVSATEFYMEERGSVDAATQQDDGSVGVMALACLLEAKRLKTAGHDGMDGREKNMMKRLTNVITEFFTIITFCAALICAKRKS